MENEEAESCGSKYHDVFSQEDRGIKKRKRLDNESVLHIGLTREVDANFGSECLKKQCNNKQMYDGTVIIGWKGWSALESEKDEEGVEALVNRRRQQSMDWECQHCTEEADNVYSQILLTGTSVGLQGGNVKGVGSEEKGSNSKEITVRSIPSIEQVEKVVETNLEFQIQRDDKYVDLTVPDQETLVSLLSDPVSSPLTTAYERELGNQGGYKIENFDIHEPDKSAPVVGTDIHRNSEEATGANYELKMLTCSSSDSRCPTRPEFEPVTDGRTCTESAVTEINDINYTLDSTTAPGEGKVKLLDIKTVYCKSRLIDGPRTLVAFSEEHNQAMMAITKTEQGRGCSKEKGNIAASNRIKGLPVPCPICKEKFIGDVHDACFNNLFNQHVDHCMEREKLGW